VSSTRQAHCILWALTATGVVIRIVLAFTTVGSQYDMQSYQLVRMQLALHPLHVYAGLPVGNGYRWPYPPALFPWIALAGKLSAVTGLAFHGFIKLPAIAADAALGWLVQAFLGRRGARLQLRVLAASLVLLGPVFVGISGYLGQFDALAILPAFAALMVWEDPRVRDRALVAGALIGVGAAFKTVPILMLVALLPSTRGRREAAVLVGTAVGVVLVALAPYAITELGALRTQLHYTGVPGTGGLSLAVQPDYARRWLSVPYVKPNSLFQLLYQHGQVYTATLMAALLAFMWWRRVGAVAASVILWLTIYALGSGFLFQYFVWGLPFFLAAGYVWRSAALQAVSLVPMALAYFGPWRSDGPVALYVVVMLVLWGCFMAALAVILHRAAVGKRQLALAPG
jgi:Glycosyltransferase family 87